MARYVTIRGIQLRYVVRGDVILPEDDNNIVAVVSEMCRVVEDLIGKVEYVMKSPTYSMLRG